MLRLLSLLFCFVALSVSAQRYEYVYRNPGDSSVNGYLKVFPETDSIKGLIVRDYSRLPDMTQPSRYQFLELSSQAGFLTLYTATSQHTPELFVNDSSMYQLDSLIREVVQAHAIPKGAIFIGGMSASGTRALRYAQFVAQGKTDIRLAGVFAVDPPLDLARFYQSCAEHHGHFKKGMLEEAQYMLPYFNQLFGGSPSVYPESYRHASVFSHTDSLGGNAQGLLQTPLIFFHEPDMDWLMQERGAQYFDINSYDIDAMAEKLKNQGHPDLTVVSTSGKGFDANGDRKCHSWTIVDEPILIQWLLKHIPQ